MLTILALAILSTLPSQDMAHRGAAAMGFDQHKTTHHFRLRPDGGSIDVEANDPSDAASRDAVREHLKLIAAQFAAGDFGKPLATHGEVPSGVRTMQARKSSLHYEYKDLPRGGQVIVTTSDRRARNAVHEFLRYQIREHATHDPLTIQR